MKYLLIVSIYLGSFTASSFAQNRSYDSLKREVFMTIDNVRYNFDEYIRRYELTKPKFIQVLGFDVHVLYRYSDTMRNIDFETGWYKKEWREKDAFFRENLIKIMDEYAKANGLIKEFKVLENDKKDNKESGARLIYKYMDSTGRIIASIGDIQKKGMNVNFINYPKIDVEAYKKKKEQQENIFTEFKNAISSNNDKFYSYSKGYISHIFRTTTSEISPIRDNDIETALIRGKFGEDGNKQHTYEIWVYGMNLTEAKVLVKEWKNGKYEFNATSLNDVTEDILSSKELTRFRGSNLKAFYLVVTTNIPDYGILAASPRGYDNVLITVYKRRE